MLSNDHLLSAITIIMKLIAFNFTIQQGGKEVCCTNEKVMKVCLSMYVLDC